MAFCTTSTSLLCTAQAIISTSCLCSQWFRPHFLVGCPKRGSFMVIEGPWLMPIIKLPARVVYAERRCRIPSHQPSIVSLAVSRVSSGFGVEERHHALSLAHGKLRTHSRASCLFMPRPRRPVGFSVRLAGINLERRCIVLRCIACHARQTMDNVEMRPYTQRTATRG